MLLDGSLERMKPPHRRKDIPLTAKQILYATDYSPASLHALQFATWLAHCTASKLLIVHVSELEQYPVGELFNEQPEPDGQELEARLKSGPCPTTGRSPASITCCMANQAASNITKPADVDSVEFANAHNVDMIVLGTHGRTGLFATC